MTVIHIYAHRKIPHRIETTGHHVKWITVYADDEIESLHIANNAVKDYAQQLKVA